MIHLNVYSEKFLGTTRLSYINPEFRNIFKQTCSVLEILTIIEIDNIITPNIFNFLGTVEYNNQETKECNYFEVFVRKNILENNNWIEIMMYDNTLSKRIEIVDETIKIKERILQKIAHEFKTPLLSIVSLTDSINNKIQKGSINIKKLINKIGQVNDLSNYTFFLINDIVQYLSNNTKNLNLLIKNINNASNNNKEDEKINKTTNTNKLNFNYENIQIIDPLNFSYRILKTLLKAYKKINYIRPILEIDENINDLNISTDPLRLKQVLLNLLSNSVKFTQTGYIKIKATLDITEMILMISVIDTGSGMKQEELNKLFKENNMLERHRNLNTMGSGLGLAISHQIANLMGYKLTVNSSVGEGSAFTLKIGLVKQKREMLWGSCPNLNQICNNNGLELVSKNFRSKSPSYKTNRKFISQKNKLFRNRANSFSKFNAENQKYNNKKEVNINLKKSKFFFENNFNKSSKLENINEEKNRNKNVNIMNIKDNINSQININYNRINNYSITDIQKTKINDINKNKFKRDHSIIELINSSDSISNSNDSNKDLSEDNKSYYSGETVERKFELHEIQNKRIKILKKIFLNNLNPRINKSEIILNKYTMKNSKMHKLHEYFQSNLDNNLIPKSQDNLIIKNKFNIDNAPLFIDTIRKFNLDVTENFPTKITQQIRHKILVIDDVPEIRKTLANLIIRILNRSNLNNIDIIKGEDGIDMVKILIESQRDKSKILCVFIDENMNYMNGSEAIKIVREFQRNGKIKPVYICRVSGDDYYNINGTEIGPDYTISKPSPEGDVKQVLINSGVIIG